jgi:hypothetical protein
MLAGRITPPIKSAFLPYATLTFKKKLFSFTPAKPAN